MLFLANSGDGIYAQENTQILCSDGLDNDGDGLSDCEDGDCQSICADNLLGECVLIDFETIVGITPSNFTPIGTQYLGLGVSFILDNGELPILVDYGGDTEAFFGVAGDTPQPEFADELGAFFITDDGIPNGQNGFTFILDFQLPINFVSAQILDMDNQETFTATAFNESDEVVGSTTITSSSPETGNGIPTTWSIESDGACIWRLELEGQSSGGISFGYGMDNLEFCFGELEDLCQCATEEADSPWLQSICSGCLDPAACNYNPEVLFTADVCIYPDGCTDDAACNYDAAAQCDDNSCLYGIGCMDPDACNFDVLAECQGMCSYPDGCTDAAACNYDVAAQCDDNSCLYGIGCMDPDGCNFDALAECEGMCIYPDGCTDAAACNYSPANQCDDGSCFYPDGCTDSGACNFNPEAQCNDGSCDYSCLGCTDPLACNFNSDPQVTVDDGSCTYPGCTDSSACNYNLTAGCDDGSCLLADGCTFSNACNYDPEALGDDGSCDFISCADCAGNPFGDSEIDTCGVCLLPTDELWNFSCVGQLYAPNAFTPDGDNLNDVWQLKTARFLYEFDLKIFNRWGDQVFHSTNIEEPWLGNDRDGDHFVQNGIYSFLVVYSFSPADIRKQTGVITMMR